MKRPRPLMYWLDMVTGCWEWGGTIQATGYGQLNGGYPAHRAMYKALVGPIPNGLQLDHLCRNRPCVNPAHLEPVTPAENTRRGLPYRAVRIACHAGHYYAPGTFRWSQGARRCLICERERELRRQPRRQARRVEQTA